MKAVAAFLQVLCYLTVTNAWTCRVSPQPHRAVQIDAGMGSVVMRDRKDHAYFLSGSSWKRLGSIKLKHVSVGPAGIWGVGRNGKVYKYVAGNFVPSNGRRLRQVDAGGYGQVVGVSRNSNTYCLNSNSATAYNRNGNLYWSSLSRSLIYYSCGPLYGCWGTDSNNRIFLTPRIIPNSCGISGWMLTDGLAKMAEVGTDGNVFVLNSEGNVFQRNGISIWAPQGWSWSYIPIGRPIKHVSYDLGRLWVVTTSGVIMRCSQ